MSKLGQLKKKVNDEGSVPRCSTCKAYRPSQVLLSTDSQTFRKNHHCGVHGFTITPNAICDGWHGTDGSTLERKPC